MAKLVGEMTERFEIVEKPFKGTFLLKRTLLGDERGHLGRLFCSEELQSFGWEKPVAQINETVTAMAGTLRGLHYQSPPFAEMKLVTCLKGEVHDVVLDLRKSSPTFGKTFAARLSAENAYSLLMPEGFAHGFQTLEPDVRILYVHSAPHSADHEGGIDALDPGLGIDWPLAVSARSKRDLALPVLAEDFEGIDL